MFVTADIIHNSTQGLGNDNEHLFPAFPHIVGEEMDKQQCFVSQGGTWLGREDFQPAPRPTKVTGSDLVFLPSFVIPYSTPRNLVQIYL